MLVFRGVDMYCISSHLSIQHPLFAGHQSDMSLSSGARTETAERDHGWWP